MSVIPLTGSTERANLRKFSGKTLLLLGSSAGSVSIAKYARGHGARVIVTDNLPEGTSEAKSHAHEVWNISTGDLTELLLRIQAHRVDGIFAGISEFNLLSALELSDRAGLRFPFTRTQWNSISVKDEFRLLCIQHSVPHPELFYSGSSIVDARQATLRYPAVLKPVDASASTGVRICSDFDDVASYFEESRAASDGGRVLIEEYVEGVEFTAHYSVVEGRAVLSCVDNRYPVAVNVGNVTTVPVARVYPSLFLDAYMETVNLSMIALAESLGTRNSILFVQGMYNPEEGSFAIFEGGLRSAAEYPSRFLERVNGVNALHLMADQILIGESSFDQSLEDPALGGKCCGVISFVATGGTVGAIEGLEAALVATPSVIETEVRYPVGAVTPAGDTLHQLMIRFVMICASRDQLARDIAFLNKNVQVRATDGTNLVIKMDPDRVHGVI